MKNDMYLKYLPLWVYESIVTNEKDRDELLQCIYKIKGHKIVYNDTVKSYELTTDDKDIINLLEYIYAGICDPYSGYKTLYDIYDLCYTYLFPNSNVTDTCFIFNTIGGTPHVLKLSGSFFNGEDNTLTIRFLDIFDLNDGEHNVEKK